MPSHRSIVIFSGGTAANHLVDIFETIRKSKDCPLSYIIPISDNGGSSSELIRVFGGPGIGDVRSRLVRLIPRLPQGSSGFKEREAIRAIFNYRLSPTDSREAKLQWTDVVDGTSHLWKDISSAKKELIRSFFNLVNAEVTKRSRPPNSTFDFTSASVGNLFLTGARLFSGSFESAIYLLSSVCGIEDEGVKVIPSINSNFSHHIAAGLEDGTVIVGQNAISHPSPEVVGATSAAAAIQALNGGLDTPINPLVRRPSGMHHYYGDEHDTDAEEQEAEDANLPGTLPTLRTKNIKFNKDAHLNEDLPARISRIWYINPYGQEILPPANPRAIQALNNAQAVIYSIGSLYTSLMPSLVLRGIGDALRRNSSAGGKTPRTKILILNGCLDREVGPQPPHEGANGSTFSAVDFVEAIVRAGEQSRGVAWEGDHSHNSDTSGINTLEPFNVEGATTSLESKHGVESGAEAVSPSMKKRPGLLSSKSESILRTSLRAHHAHAMLSQHQSHLFPPPLLASTANSRATSREASPTPSPPGTPGYAVTLNTNASSAPRSNSTIDALSSLPPSLQHSSTTNTPVNIPKSPHFFRPNELNPPTTTTTTNTATTSTPPPKPNPIYTSYITHLIHLPNSPTTPFVDRDLLLSRYGIQCIKVYGRSVPDSHGEGGMRYDHAALRGAIEAVLGRRAERVMGVPEEATRMLVGRGISAGGSGRRGKSETIGAGSGSEQEWEWEWRVRALPRRNTLDT